MQMRIMGFILALGISTVGFSTTAQAAGEAELLKAIQAETASRNLQRDAELAENQFHNLMGQNDPVGALESLNNAFDLANAAAMKAIESAEAYDDAYYAGIPSGRASSDLMYAFSNHCDWYSGEMFKMIINAEGHGGIDDSDHP